MKQSIFILPLLFSFSLVSNISAMEYQYDLSVAKIDQDKFKIQMSKTGNAGKQSCSFITNFATRTCDDQKNQSALFDMQQTSFSDLADVNIFSCKIPGIGLLKQDSKGSTVFEQYADDALLVSEKFTLCTPDKLFVQKLNFAATLYLKSPETQLCGVVIADQICADHKVCNSGSVQTNQLMGPGDFTNEGLLKFIGTKEDPAQLGMKLFRNGSRHHKPTVQATYLQVTRDNKKILNKKDALFEVSDELEIDREYAEDLALHNNGVCKANVCNSEGHIVNKGFFQSNTLDVQKLDNKEFGQVKILDQITIGDLTNDGEIDVNQSIQVQQGLNRGSIVGSPKLALCVCNDLKNYGNIRLHQLLGAGHLLNQKALLFNDNSNISVKDLTNYGLLKAASLHLNNTKLSNTISGLIELFGKSVIGNATITNNGSFAMEGDIDFSATKLWNKGQMSFKAGRITCVETRLSNKDTGKWLIESMKSVQPLEMDNEGVLELIDSSVDFERMRNYKELLIRGGTSTFKKLINSGIVKTGLLHLIPNALLQNLQGGSVEVFEKSIIDHATVTNDGEVVMQGDTDFTFAQVYNRSAMTFRNGALHCANITLRNLDTGKWLMERIKSAAPVYMHNEGVLELANSSLDFKRLKNDDKLILHDDGAYRIEDFQNKTLDLCGTDWAILDRSAPHYASQLIITDPKITEARLGEMRCEKDLLYDLAVMPTALRTRGDIRCSNMCKRVDQLKSITTSGKVTAWAEPASIANGDIAFPNIGLLELHVNGPLTKLGSLTAPALSLCVQGPFTGGKSNTELATIAATHGPLKVNAHSIDGSFTKFYGKGKTDIESTKGDIKIGAPARGVDEAIKQQFMNNLYNSPYYDKSLPRGSIFYHRRCFNLIIDSYLANFDYTLNVPNGAYAVSDDHLTLKAATHISVNHGKALSRLGIDLIAPAEVANWSGKVSSFGPVNIETGIYWHERGGYVGRVGWPTLPSTHAGTAYPTGVAAILESLRRVNFKTNKIINNASSIRSGESIFLNGSGALCPATGYHESVISINHSWVSPWTGSHSYPALTLAPIVQSGENIQMNLGNFVISGNWNAPGVLMFAKTGLFSNGGKLTRDTKQITGPEIVDVTQSMRQEAQRQGFYKLGFNGAVEIEFPFGVPSVPRIEDLVALENPQYHTPFNWKSIFNPLSSINLDLHLQQLLSEVAGKVYAGRAKGDQLATVLWGNAKKWREQHGKEIMSQHELQHINQSMLLAQIAHDGMTEEQKLLLCIAPQDINPHQDAGVIVTDEFRCETEGDQTHQNNQIIAQGPGGIAVQSQAGNMKLETQSYRTVYACGDIVEDHAYPQQQFIAPQGPVHAIAHCNIERTGTAIAAGQEVVEHAQTGSVTKNPLVLQKIVTIREEDEGLFSSSETITTNISHQILPSTTIAGTHLHDQAGSSIHAVAPQDIAGQSITYQAPNTVVEGIILADKTEVQSSSSGMFSEQSYSEMRETPCAMAATIRAPQVSFVGDTARINANITAHGLHDNTRDGAQFVAKVKEMLYSQQALVDSPLMSMDAGCKGGYETMIPPMLMVDRIIRASPIGQMLFESAVIDKDRTEIIGRFVETTYQLKKWHEEWCHKDQLISDEMLVVVAAAITFATQGMGAELLALAAESVAATAMVNAGFSAICATAGTSFLRTGDPLQAIEKIASAQFLKSLAFDVASAGLCEKLGGVLKVPMGPGTKSLMGHVKEHALRSTVNTFLNVAINNAPVGKSIGNACAQIPLNAVAGYVANSICDSHLNGVERKVTHSLLGGAVGFAQGGNSKGLASGAVGALTAETVGTLLTEDAFAVSDAAIGRLKKDDQPLTQESIQKAVQEEVEYRMKIAKIAAGTVAAVAKLNPSIASQAAANVTDNDTAIRAQIYAMSEMQSLLIAASQAIANLAVQKPEQSVEQQIQESKSAGKKRERSTPKNAKATSRNETTSDAAHNLVLNTIQNRAKPYSYDDLIMQCAHEWNPHDDIQEKKEKRTLFDRIVNPDVNPMIKETSEIIQAAFDHAINETINTYAMVPNPVGLACFAAETGRDLYQERTTLGELAFNMAVGYGALKGLLLTGKVGKKVYNYAQSKLRGSTPEVHVPFVEGSFVGKAASEADAVLTKVHQGRYAAERRVPFVEDPLAGKWSEATMSGDLVLGCDPFNMAYDRCTRYACKIDPAAPFNVVGHGNSAIMALEIQNIHPKALSQANLRILKEKGEVILNVVQLARVIRTAPGYRKGQPVHLFSCETGARADGLAQRLSTRMDVEVSAFTENVHVFKDKPLFAAYCKETEKVGAVKTFFPQSGVSKAVASSILLAGCDSCATHPVDTYDDLMKEYASGQQTEQQRSLLDRIVNPEMSPFVKESSEIIHVAISKLFNISNNIPTDTRRRIPFVEDGKRGTWKKACISGDLILSKRKAQEVEIYLRVKKNWDKDKRCPFNVVGHGSPFCVQIDTQEIHPGGLDLSNEKILRVEGNVKLNAKELKQLIETAPGYRPGQPVNLFSCQCGEYSEGIAQELADEMRVPVSACTGNIVTYYNSRMDNAFFTAGDLKTGFKEIKTFYPREPRQRRISNIPDRFGYD